METAEIPTSFRAGLVPDLVVCKVLRLQLSICEPESANGGSALNKANAKASARPRATRIRVEIRRWSSKRVPWPTGVLGTGTSATCHVGSAKAEVVEKPILSGNVSVFCERRRFQALLKKLQFRAIEASLFLTCIQFFDYPFQLFKLLPSLAKFAFRRQAFVVGKVFAGLYDECVEVRLLRYSLGCMCRLRSFRGTQRRGRSAEQGC